MQQYGAALGPIEADIASWVRRASPEDLQSVESITRALGTRVKEQQATFQAVFAAQGADGAGAGRALAARELGAELAFDLVPRKTLEEIESWASTAADSTLDTITKDAAHWLRGAHEEGLSIDEISAQINEELFDNRLEGYVSERAARTGTLGTSNAGKHATHEDLDSVVAERWVATGDDRTRDSHVAADGQVVAVGDTFSVGGDELEHPGDPNGSLEEIVNCRCTVVGVFRDDLDDDQLDDLGVPDDPPEEPVDPDVAEPRLTEYDPETAPSRGEVDDAVAGSNIVGTDGDSIREVHQIEDHAIAVTEGDAFDYRGMWSADDEVIMVTDNLWDNIDGDAREYLARHELYERRRAVDRFGDEINVTVGQSDAVRAFHEEVNADIVEELGSGPLESYAQSTRDILVEGGFSDEEAMEEAMYTISGAGLNVEDVF